MIDFLHSCYIIKTSHSFLILYWRYLLCRDPRGAKIGKPSVRRKGVANAESISEAKAAVATQIEALTSEVNEAAAALKAKKAELKDAQNQLAKIEKQEAALAEQAAQNQRKADAEKLATAFLESGKSLDEVLRALQ